MSEGEIFALAFSIISVGETPILPRKNRLVTCGIIEQSSRPRKGFNPRIESDSEQKDRLANGSACPVKLTGYSIEKIVSVIHRNTNKSLADGNFKPLARDSIVNRGPANHAGRTDPTQKLGQAFPNDIFECTRARRRASGRAASFPHREVDYATQWLRHEVSTLPRCGRFLNFKLIRPSVS
jgi:hypothetical protein